MIIEIVNLIEHDVSLLISSAEVEGHNHINRLMSDYKSKKNQFKLTGEKLIGYKVGDQLAAVCGLNIESENPNFGRIRRLYIVPKYRKQKIGSQLVKFLIDHSTSYFSAVTVNIGRLPIDKFYEILGFKRVNQKKGYSHIYKVIT